MGLKTYFEETYDELVNKVSWPTWSELQSSAIIVMVASVIIAIAVVLMDVTLGINSSDKMAWKGVLGLFYSMFK
ncbi:MAG: preprotein translocase subunit SecE [Flavobacteriales bacterium]|nr:preprotein translocase subunit SecE [Flavobacteriales bacterium]MCB9447455.1 preprotein translocase subunit SecE [Flavobacteriales bacterium]